jgi:hypothetical protein
MLRTCTDYDLLGKVEALCKEVDAPHTNDGHHKLPMIRIRDNGLL